MTDRELELLAKVFVAVALAAFAPQILRFMRRVGYREESEFNSRKWRRGAAIAAVSVLLLAVGLAL